MPKIHIYSLTQTRLRDLRPRCDIFERNRKLLLREVTELDDVLNRSSSSLMDAPYTQH